MATALITGGTSGIGAAFARALAARGYDLVLVARDETRLRSAADRLHTASGIDVQILAADLSVRSDVTRVAERLADPDRPIDMLVNNAGLGVHTSLLAADTTAHEHAFDVMCRAVLVLGAAAGRAMRERNQGAIVNVASVAGLITMGSYSAIKAWVGSYSESLAVEMRKTDVTVTALLPGWVTTEFHERAGIRTGSIPKGLWIDADRLVAATLRDVDRGRVISIPTVRYQVLAWFARRLPRRTVRWISGAISSSRNDDGSEHPSMGAHQQR
jgi:short-subunit dehydrogenase